MVTCLADNFPNCFHFQGFEEGLHSGINKI